MAHPERESVGWAPRLSISQPPHPFIASHLAGFGTSSPSATNLTHVDVALTPNPADTEPFRLFDSWLANYTAVRDGRARSTDLSQWPPTGEYWTSFCKWTVDEATRFANLPWPLPRYIRLSSRWSLKRDYGWDRNSTFGWIVFRDPIDPWVSSTESADSAFAITPKGEVTRCTHDGHILPDDLMAIDGQADDAPIASAALLRAVARWRAPFQGPHHILEPVIGEAGHVTLPR